MNKALVLSIVAVAAVWLFFQFLSSSLDVSNDPAYSGMVGKRLLTLKDLYLVDFGAGEDPSVGDSSCISDDIPSEVRAENSGQRYGGVTVSGFLPKGSVLTIDKVKKNINTQAEYKGRVEISGQSVDLSFIQDYSGSGDFKSGFVEILN